MTSSEPTSETEEILSTPATPGATALPTGEAETSDGDEGDAE